MLILNQLRIRIFVKKKPATTDKHINDMMETSPLDSPYQEEIGWRHLMSENWCSH